jgi:peroxiredoxin
MRQTTLLALLISAATALCIAQEPPGPQLGPALEEKTTPEVSAILERALSLKDAGRIEDALRTVDEALPKYPEKTFDRYALLTVKFELLSGQAKTHEALAAAIEKANIVTSPRQALNVARVFLKLGDAEHALVWLEASVNRGLQSYTIFEDDVYRPLQADPRFRSLADIVKKRNGLGQPAKPFLGRTTSGQEVSLEKYKGRVLLLDFWATWCGPCQAEMPNIVRCYNEFKDKGFEIIGFAEDEDNETLNKFLRKYYMTWPIVSKDDDHYEAVVESYAVKNIPASFLIDKQGVLRQVNLTGADLRRAVEQLIKE